MESRVNYTLVGLFVLLLGAMGIIIPLWLTSGLNQQEYKTYIVYMNEAVDGLSANAPVTYNGVQIGNVKKIRLNPHNTEQVELLLNIQLGTPITTHTTATLQSQGVTGVAYIGLNGGVLKGAEPLKIQPPEIYPRIQALPSIRVRLDTALTELMKNMTHLNQQLNNLINPRNAKALSEILNNINHLTKNFSDHTTDIDKSLASLNTLLQNLSQTSQNFPGVSRQLESVLLNLQAVTQEIKQNPSVIIRGKPQPSLGPGEK